MPITIAHPKIITIGDGTNTNIVRPADWNSVHGNTLSLTGSEIASLFNFSGGLSSISGPGGITAGISQVGFFEPFILPNTNSTLFAPGIGTWYLEPFILPKPISNGLIFMPIGGGLSTNQFQDGAIWSATLSGSNTRYQTHRNCIALYKLGSGQSTSRLESFWSGEMSHLITWERRHSGSTTSNATISNYLTISVPFNWDTVGNITYTTNSASGSTSYGASTGASTLASGLITGPARFLSGSRLEVIGLNTTIPPGVYWFGHMLTSSTSSQGTNYTGGTVYTTQSRLGLLENALGAFKRIGNSTTNSSTNAQIFKGYLGTTTSGVSSIIDTSNIRSTTGRLYWNFAQTTF